MTNPDLLVYDLSDDHTVVELFDPAMELHVVRTSDAASPTLAWWEDDEGQILHAVPVGRA